MDKQNCSYSAKMCKSSFLILESEYQTNYSTYLFSAYAQQNLGPRTEPRAAF